MRNLTIKRTKSFVGCLAKMKLYIEDASASEIMINNVPCRKIGELKNGEEKTFTIDGNEAKLFVIADKLSKNYCNEFYQLPQGDYDMYLSGKNQFNPAAGNAFRFDGVQSEAVLKNRKKGKIIGLVVLIAAIIFGYFIGNAISSGLFSMSKAKPKDFSSNGMSITLTDEFYERTMWGYTVCYDSSKAAVFALKEGFDLVEDFENASLEEYGALVLKSNNCDSSVKLQNDHGLTYFEYDFSNPETNETYSYFTVLYKTSDAFWIVQFTTLEDKMDSYRQQFIDWAKAVTFED